MTRRIPLVGLFVASTLVVPSCRTTPPPTRPALFEPGASQAGAEATFDALARPGATCEVQLLDGNQAAWVARWNALQAAQHTIDSTYFILSPDVFGLSFLGMMNEKARAGVHVRLMVDSRGSFEVSHTLGRDLLEEMVATGNVDARIYNPMTEKVISTIAKFNSKESLASTHDKILLIDGKQAVLGGRNIADEYMAHPADLPEAFADLDMLVEGEALSAVRKAFEEEFSSERARRVKKDLINIHNPSKLLRINALAMDAWMRAAAIPNPDSATDEERAQWRAELSKAVLDALDTPPKGDDADAFETAISSLLKYPRLRGASAERGRKPILAETKIVNAHSALGEATQDLNELVIALMKASEHEMVVQNPYIVLTERGWKVLKEVADSGVKITILTNGPTSSDSDVTSALFLKIWKDMLALSPNIRLYVFGERGPLHAKAGVFDGKVTLLGSYNLDLLSARFNSEILAVVKSTEFAQQNRDEILRRVSDPPPSVYEYKIRRNEDGSAMRYPEGHERAGEIVSEFGPEDHVDEKMMKRFDMINTAIDAGKLLPSFAPLL